MTFQEIQGFLTNKIQSSIFKGNQKLIELFIVLSQGMIFVGDKNATFV